jgi:hypothetical protein
MSITQKLFSAAALVVLIGISACNDDEGTGQLSKDDAKTRLDEFNASASGDLQGFADTDGVQAIKDFFDLAQTDDPFGRISVDKGKFRAFFHEKGKAFRSIFVKDKAFGRTKTGAFSFEEHAGVYAWNPELGEQGEFELIDESNIIVILFPTEGSQTNNARLEITALSEVEIYDEEWDEYRYELAELKATLDVNQTEVASIDLEIVWDELGFPLSGSVTLEVSPYKATVSFNDAAATSSSISASFSKGERTLVAVSITANYTDDSKSEESLSNLEGYVQFLELKVQGTINVAAADEQEVDWNEIVDVALYHNNDKLGDVVFVIENEEPVPYLQYADGSTEKLETVLKPVIDEIETLTEELDDDNG